MERIVIQDLIRWKSRAGRKPLILNGVRQVGKTWLLREFARTQYAKEAYVVCRHNDAVRQIFTQDFDVARILRSLRAITSVDITPGDTLVILDEVQEVPEILESLKYFQEEAPEYHIAVAGSLLGIALHRGISYPVGKVDTLRVYPMNFEEFLMAKGMGEMCKLLQSRDFAAIAPLHRKFTDLLREYYYVGGMPEAVQHYVSTGALQEVRAIQKDILNGYEQDFSKHVGPDQVARIRQVWNSIPSQLFKENKKFIYGALRKGARANDYELAIEWLIDAGLVYKVPRCTRPALPLSIYEDLSAFKLYLADVGLLGAMVDTDAAQVLVQSTIFQEFKGGLTEQYVLQQLLSHGVAPIYYHSAPDSRLEIDFLIQRDARLLPIEVKAEGNTRANSLTKLLSQNPSLHAERYSMLPYVEQESLTNVPLYAV
jgi:predicted AAA+ superfamily ATPase